MYLDLFKLRELPFRLSPDPEFLYLSKNHARAKAYMESTIWFTDGFVVITGEIGSGKTTLIETFLKELDQDVVVAQINQTQVSALEFLQTLLVQFGFQPFKMKKAEILATLNQFLIEQYASNRKVLVIVDEAQNLSSKVLEEVRMLSGVETTKDKVLRIILAGQPELNHKLDAPELVQLVQRVRLRFHLSALTREDMEGYIRHRLEVAGADGRDIFLAETFDQVYRYTGGTPRLINTLCDTSMMAAFSADREVVTLADVDAAIAELQWVEFSERPTSAALAPRDHDEAGDGDDEPAPRRVSTATKVAPKVGRIVVSTDQGDVAEVVLRVGRMVVGRTADNDLQIDSRFVSRHHCQVVSTADLSVIEDLNSTNGIFLNQKKIRRHVLIDGDIIELGTHRLRYVEERTGGAGSSGVDTLPGAQETALLE
jgi:general secretion pathway protein A